MKLSVCLKCGEVGNLMTQESGAAAARRRYHCCRLEEE